MRHCDTMPPRGAGRVSGADDGAAMKSNWTPSRDKRLLGQQAAGRTAAQIGKSLGGAGNGVLGRSRRLPGIVYKSDIESWARANARRSQEARKRMKARQKAQRKGLGGLGGAGAG